MSLIKIIGIIIFLWGVYQIKKNINNIKISSGERNNKSIKKNSNLDIQDADYEELE